MHQGGAQALRPSNDLQPAPRLAGLTAVVTGASSGIGRATAVELARRGADVVLAARGPEALEEAARACERDGAGRALAVPTDVGDEAQVRALAAAALDRFGTVDLWVNNAGVMVYGTLDAVPEEVSRRVVQTNLMGTMYGSKAIVSHFIERERGVIVNVASLYAKVTSPYVSSYVTSKFGILGFSEVLRQELRHLPDVHVCSILPSSVDTPIFRHAGNYAGRTARPVPPVVAPDRVVSAIIRCIDRPRNEVHVGTVGRLLSWGHAALPRLYGRLVVPVMDHVAFGEPNVEPGPGNVFEPTPPYGDITSGWRTTSEREAMARDIATLPGQLLRQARGRGG